MELKRKLQKRNEKKVNFGASKKSSFLLTLNYNLLFISFVMLRFLLGDLRVTITERSGKGTKEPEKDVLEQFCRPPLFADTRERLFKSLVVPKEAEKVSFPLFTFSQTILFGFVMCLHTFCSVFVSVPLSVISLIFSLPLALFTNKCFCFHFTFSADSRLTRKFIMTAVNL
jgi:hypothetical protein